MTVDFVVSAEGLEVVDVAVVPNSGPSYEPFVGADVKERIATQLMSLLGFHPRDVDLELELSERYHQVGFALRIDDSVSPQVLESLTIDGDTVLDLARQLDIPALKISICAVRAYDPASGDADLADPGLLAELPINASEPGSSRRDRTGCETWVQTAQSEGLVISVGPAELPPTGLAGWTAAGALGLLIFGVWVIRSLLGRVRRNAGAAGAARDHRRARSPSQRNRAGRWPQDDTAPSNAE
jgi:hypothetical protein